MINNTKDKTLQELKKIGAKIGMLELQRMSGHYVPVIEILKLKREFASLKRIYFTSSK